MLRNMPPFSAASPKPLGDQPDRAAGGNSLSYLERFVIPSLTAAGTWRRPPAS